MCLTCSPILVYGIKFSPLKAIIVYDVIVKRPWYDIQSDLVYTKLSTIFFRVHLPNFDLG